MDIKNNLRNIEVPADEIFESFLTSYAKDIATDQFPHYIDGLKAAHRRALISILPAGDNGISANKAIGDIKIWHIKGDASIWALLARLSLSTCYNPPLLNIIGNSGSYSNRAPAAARYIDHISLQSSTRSIFFDRINLDTLPQKKAVDVFFNEPSYLIPALPTALWLGNVTIGYGHSSRIPPMNFTSLCQLTALYCRHRQSGTLDPFPLHKYAELLIPDFPIKLNLLNKEALIKEYKKENYLSPIYVEGKVILSHNTIEILTLPPAVDFSSIEQMLEAEIKKSTKSKSSSNIYNDSIVDFKQTSNEKDIGRLVITLKNNVNVFDFWLNHVKKLIKFRGTFVPNYRYTDSKGTLFVITISELLDKWFTARASVLESTKRRKLAALSTERSIQEAYYILLKNDAIDKAIEIIKTSDEENAAITRLSETFDLSRFQASHLIKARLTLLLRTSAERVKQEIESLELQITTLCESFKNIAGEMHDHAVELERKYSTKRRTEIPEYIGYASVGDGCIQFSSIGNIYQIVDRFPKSELAIHMYDGNNHAQVDNLGKLVKGTSIPEYTKGEIYGFDFPLEEIHTVNFSEEDGRTIACCVPEFVPGRRSSGFFYTSKKSIVIERFGKIRKVDVTEEFGVRKTVCRGIFTDCIYIYPYTENPHYLIIMNDADPNKILIQKIQVDGSTSFNASPMGDLYILHHYTGNDWYFSIPKKFLSRVHGRVFCLKNLEELLGDKKFITIDLLAKKGLSKYLEIL